MKNIKKLLFGLLVGIMAFSMSTITLAAEQLTTELREELGGGVFRFTPNEFTVTAKGTLIMIR